MLELVWRFWCLYPNPGAGTRLAQLERCAELLGIYLNSPAARGAAWDEWTALARSTLGCSTADAWDYLRSK